MNKLISIGLLVLATTVSAQEGQPPRPMQPRPEMVGRPTPFPPMGPMQGGPLMYDRMMWNHRRMMVSHNRRPRRLEMAPVREQLTEKQRKALFELRNEYIKKREHILKNP